MELYLLSCAEGREIFNFYIHGRKYLTENIDLYSVTDLIEFTEETLEGTVKTCLTLGRKHVMSCERCMMKGNNKLSTYCVRKLLPSQNIV